MIPGMVSAACSGSLYSLFGGFFFFNSFPPNLVLDNFHPTASPSPSYSSYKPGNMKAANCILLSCTRHLEESIINPLPHIWTHDPLAWLVSLWMIGKPSQICSFGFLVMAGCNNFRILTSDLWMIWWMLFSCITQEPICVLLFMFGEMPLFWF